MKNPSIAKMVKMAGDNRTAMKMKAEEAAAMKMKKAAMKLREEAAMKKAHEAAMKLKKESSMKMGHKSPAKKGHKDPEYTTHGNPSKYTTSSGKSVDSANIDEGNLSTVKTGSDGRKFVVVQDATEKFKAGTKLYLPKDSAAKMKKSAMKNKSFDDSTNFTQTEKERQEDRGEQRNPKQKRRNFYNEKKARRKAEKSRKADAKARTARAKMEEAVYGKNFKNVTAEGKLKPKTKKEQKAADKASKKAIRTDKRARVAEAVAQRQLSKKGGEAAGPKRPKREKKSLGVVSGGQRPRLLVGETIKNIKDDITSGERKARRQRNTKARHEFQLKRRRYRQTQGLRGDINVRRKAKGKDAI